MKERSSPWIPPHVWRHEMHFALLFPLADDLRAPRGTSGGEPVPVRA